MDLSRTIVFAMLAWDSTFVSAANGQGGMCAKGSSNEECSASVELLQTGMEIADLAVEENGQACEPWCFDRSLRAVCIPSNPRYDAEQCDSATMDLATVCTWSGCSGCSECPAPNTYIKIGNGNCRDSNWRLYPGSYDKLGQSEATCQAQCDADSACEAFTIYISGRHSGSCSIYGTSITSSPDGWSYREGNGGGDITSTTADTPFMNDYWRQRANADRYCMKKQQA